MRIVIALIAFAVTAFGQTFDLFDQFGGAKGLPCPTGAKAHFYTEKIVDRWWFCTPDGNAFWSVSAWNVDGAQVTALQKYGATSSVGSAPRTLTQARRIKEYGFNLIDMYSAIHASPSFNSNSVAFGSGLPTVPSTTLRPAFYGAYNRNSYLSFPLKRLEGSIDWMNSNTSQRAAAWWVQDVFDSRMKTYTKSMMQLEAEYSHAFTGTAATKWTPYFSVDETDNLIGFGAGSDFITLVNGAAATSDWKRHPHLGMLILASPPYINVETRDPLTRTEQPRGGVLFGNPRTQTVDCKDPLSTTAAGNPLTQSSDTNCTKQALMLFLGDKYDWDISALNTAWNTGGWYTSFDTTETPISRLGVTVEPLVIGTTDGSVTVTGTIPVTAPNKITPQSVRIYVDGVHMASDTNAMDYRNSSITGLGGLFACDGGAATGYLWGQGVNGEPDANNSAVITGPDTGISRPGCTSTINYTTGAFTLSLGEWKIISLVKSGTTATIGFGNTVAAAIATKFTSVGQTVLVAGAVNSGTTSPNNQGALLNGSWVVTGINVGAGTMTLTITSGAPDGTYSSGVLLATNTQYPGATMKVPSIPTGLNVSVDYTINGWRAGGRGLLDTTLIEGQTWAPRLNVTYSATNNDYFLMTGTHYYPAFKTDMDEFFEIYSRRYFQDIRDAMDELTPGCDRGVKGTCYLYAGPTYLGTWSAPPPVPVLKAAATYIDVYPYYTIPMDITDEATGGQARLNHLATHYGDKPIISWEGFAAGEDSPMPRILEFVPRAKYGSQALRGAKYKEVMQSYLDATNSYGVHPVIGFRWWDVAPLGSQARQGVNWAPFTPTDDPLDGYCPGPGTRFEKIRGGPPITSIVVSGSTATLTVPYSATATSLIYHSTGIDNRIRISGATVDLDLNGEYTVTAYTNTTLTVTGLTNVTPATYTEAGMKIEYTKYTCGGTNARCLVFETSGACGTDPGEFHGPSLNDNGWPTGDPRLITDPDGPFNNRFGDFISHIREANKYWLNLIPRPKVAVE